MKQNGKRCWVLELVKDLEILWPLRRSFYLQSTFYAAVPGRFA